MNRREFIGSGLKAGALLGFPAIVRTQSGRPSLPQGVASGDVTDGQAIVWSRADRAARMFVEYSTSDRFTNVIRVPGPAALEPTDFTARVQLAGLPPGQRIFYRVLFQDLTDIRTWSDPVAGTFVTPPREPRDLKIAWSADTVGQGWGINPDFGGLRLYESIRAEQPDLFINSGDTIYADQPLASEVRLDDGSVWKNVVTEAKSRVAQTLDDFRGNFQYNLQDEHMRRFNAEVSQIVQWDDHEVRDNWYWERDLTHDQRYQLKSMALIASRARRAFQEYQPITIGSDDPDRIYRTRPFGPLAETFVLDMRSYRGPNSENRQMTLDQASALLGASQVANLKQRLAASRATWKIIASDMPLGLVVRDMPSFFEAVSNGDDGPPLGRELELADLLRFIKARRIRNVVWVTGDVHYCAAHYYNPSRATFTDFDPFWEFVAGPLHAGTFAPNPLDATFGPEVKFTGTDSTTRPNRPPSAGLQFFGTLNISASTRALTARLHNLAGQVIYSIEIPAAR